MLGLIRFPDFSMRRALIRHSPAGQGISGGFNQNPTARAVSAITRRDFVGGTLVGSGAALLTANAPGLISQAGAAVSDREFPQTIPAPLNTLN